MTRSKVADDLGQVVSAHPVDNRRRLAAAGWGLVAAVVMGLVAWALGGAGSGRSPGIAIGVVVAGLGLAALFGWRALRGGRGERFEVRERGLVHVDSRGTRAWAWDELATLHVTGNALGSALARYVGNDYRGTVTTRAGERIVITGLTADLPVLHDAVAARCEPVGDRLNRKVRWFWAAMLVVAVAAIFGLMAFMDAHPDTERVTVEGNVTRRDHVPGLTDGQVFLAAMGFVASGFLALTSVILFLLYSFRGEKR